MTPLVTATLLLALGACTATVQVLDDDSVGRSDASTPASDAGSDRPDAGELGSGLLAYTEYFSASTQDGAPVKLQQASASVDFSRAGTAWEEGCTNERIGDRCRFRRCSGTSLPSHAPAGAVAVQVGDAVPVAFEQTENGYRAQTFSRHTAAGTPIRFVSTGDEVGAFDQTLSRPAFPEVSLPAHSDAGLDGLSGISRTQALHVSLSSAYTGKVAVVLFAVDSADALWCDLDTVGASELVVPAVAMSRLDAGT